MNNRCLMHCFYLVSYNQPKIYANATWDKCGITFADQNMVGQLPRGIFIDYNDSIYLANHDNGRIIVWTKGGVNPVRELNVQLYAYTRLFVTLNGDIYFENANETGRIDKWTLNSTISVFVTKISGNCTSLFIDIHNTLYCCIRLQHKVVKMPLDGSNRTEVTVAGTGSSGTAQNELEMPSGIFVDANLNLYVADTEK